MTNETKDQNKSAFRDELIDQLYDSDRYIDLDLMATIMAQGEPIVDRLIEVMEHDDDWPMIHALLMLIEMRAEKALPAISRTLLEDPDLNEWVDSDGLDKFGPVAIDTLEGMVQDDDADWYPRAIAANALVCIAARHPETYERVTAILRSVLPDPDEEPPEDEHLEIWDSVASDLAQALAAETPLVLFVGCAQHAREIASTQMSMSLARRMAIEETPEMESIRKNVVLLLVPSMNPDGHQMECDWYEEHLATPFEGSRMPWLYHKYVGHDNNRDAFHITQIESEHLTQFLFREWYPQAQVDHHHMGSYGARFSIPPHMDPLYEEVDPIIWTEQQLYGGAMIMELEVNGKTGVETQATYPADGGPYWDESPIAHGICGMLTESASSKLATPMYIHYQQLEPSKRGRPEYRTQMNFPHPWPGGWWRLRDIVEQQKIASLAVLKTAANFRD